MKLGVFDPSTHLWAIEGACADLSARSARPQGYPFSRVRIYATDDTYAGILCFADYLNIAAAAIRIERASSLPDMRKLDFKKAGPILGARVQDAKKRLAEQEFTQTEDGYDFGEFTLPSDCVVTASRFDATDEPCRKTTGCRNFLIEVEGEEVPDLWLAILFRKEIKRFVTEDLDLHIVPPIFGDKYPELNTPCIPRVNILLINCLESVYQALEIHGEREFADYPIRLRLPTREALFRGVDRNGYQVFDRETPELGSFQIGVSWLPAVG